MLFWQQPWQADTLDAPHDDRDLDGRLRTQLMALTEASDLAAWTAGFGPGGVTTAQDTWQSRSDLGVGDVEFTLIGLAGAPDAADGSRTARLRVSWTFAGSTTSAAVVARVAGSGDGEHVDLSGFGAGSDPLPLWLAGRIGLDPDLGIVTIDDGAVERIADLVTAARSRIADLVGPDTSPAWVIVPPSPEIAAALLGRTAAELGSTAGVATTLPGTTGPAVVLNPSQFAVMDERGRQVVVTHELTHAMTGAVGSRGEVWLVEGFADWVALHGDTVPLVVAAADLMQQVAAGGVPQTLPTDADLSAATSSAAYQGAWLAVVVLEDRHDAATVLQVYRAVVAGSDLDSALAAAGTSVDELTAQWRDYVTYSASTVS